MRSIRMGDASRAAKIKTEQDRGAVITRKEQNVRNNWDLQDQVNRENLPDKTTKEKLEYEKDLKNVTEMCELLQQQTAPDLEIDIFDGNPMHFHYFMAAFKEVVENKVTILEDD